MTVFRCAGGHTTFGEKATFSKATDSHLVFVTESGAVVKTKRDNLHSVIGKAAKAGYIVTTKAYEDFEEMINEEVKFWNDKTFKFENK